MPRSPRRATRRRRQAPPEYEANDLLTLLDRVRGTDDALDVWRVLNDQMWRTRSWRAVDSVLRMIQAMADAEIFSPDERFFLISSLSDAAVPSRASLNPRFAEVDLGMSRVMREHGLGEDEAWHLDEAPEEYRALNEEWCQIADAEVARWFAELGEREMGRLLLHDMDEFSARSAAGRDELFGSDEGEEG